MVDYPEDEIIQWDIRTKTCNYYFWKSGLWLETGFLGENPNYFAISGKKLTLFTDFEERFEDFFSQTVWSQLQPVLEQQNLFLLYLIT